MEWTRREFITSVSAAALATAFPLGRAFAQTGSGVNTRDRVILCNEDSNTRLLRLTEPRLPSCPYHSQGVLLGAQTLRPARSGQPVPLNLQ
jgi:hypothetical protein